MASIGEAFDSTLKEAFGGLKVLIWAVPICMSYSLVKSNSAFGYIIAAVTAILFLGYLTESENNVVIKNNKLLPGANVLKYGLIGLYTFFVMMPFAFLSWFVWYLISTFIKIPSPVWDSTVEIIGAFLAISFTLTAHALFIRHLSPFEPFNVKKYFIGFGEIFMTFSFLVIKLAILAALLVGFAYYIFSMFVGFDNVIWQYFVSCYVVLNFFISANYMAQLSEEIYVFMEKDENKKREDAAIEKLHMQQLNNKSR